MNKQERAFQKLVLDYYDQNGRHDLPWRQTDDPYAIFVSELMLQQTQVERVIPKFTRFIQRWPSVDALARARLATVLREWQGLGYNRRAKFLKHAAETVHAVHKGRFPHTTEGLAQLPGIGPYTAAAIMTFAYNEPVVLIETNVRRVYLHHFFADRTQVRDSDILPLIERTIHRPNPRQWYSALMDYGTHLKQTAGNANLRSQHYKKQSPFRGSDREIRGAILRTLGQSVAGYTQTALHNELTDFDPSRIDTQLERLCGEAMIRKQGTRYRLG